MTEKTEGSKAAVLFKKELLNLIRKVGAACEGHLEECLVPDNCAKRTNLFLGSGNGYYSRYGVGGTEACLLSMLHKELYGYLYNGESFKTHENDKWKIGRKSAYSYYEYLVVYENMRFDCTFMNLPKEYNGEKDKRGKLNAFPIAWWYDWIIEVENDFREFAMTLRTLLDVNCKNRIGILFWNELNPEADKRDKEEFCEELNRYFEKPWQRYIDQFREITNNYDYNLHAIIFPNKYSTIEEYTNNSLLIKWSQSENSKFIVIE